MVFTVTRAQYRVLEGLAHWCYQAARCNAEQDDEGSEQARKTLAMFPEKLDKLGVPYWVQNTVSAWAADFKAEGNIRVMYLYQALRNHNIICEEM